MEYDFGNNDRCIESIKHFTGDVSTRLKVIGEFVEEIIKKRGVEPELFIGHKISQFSKLYPEEKVLIKNMFWLNRIRVILEHGKHRRIFINENNLDGVIEYTHKKEGKIIINNETVEKFLKIYIDVHNHLIEIKQN